MSTLYCTSTPAHYPSAALSGVADANAFKIGAGSRIHRPAYYVSTADIHPLSGAALNISAPVRVVSVCGTYANAPTESARRPALWASGWNEPQSAWCPTCWHDIPATY